MLEMKAYPQKIESSELSECQNILREFQRKPEAIAFLEPVD